MKLYELTSEIEKCENSLDKWAQINEGDVTDFPYQDYYEKLEGERNGKLLNLGAWAKNLRAEVEAYGVEAKVIAHKKKVTGNKLEWIENFLTSYLEKGEKLKDSRVALSWRKSNPVEIDKVLDINTLPDEYKNIVVTPNKVAMRIAILGGKELDHIRLKEKENLQIK